jgi:hypothetical protein
MTKKVEIALDADQRKYLGQWNLTEDEPALVFNWHPDNLHNFIAVANGPLPPGVIVPNFIQQPLTHR